ncbi:hypothetical protein WN55_00756 [Dufourea novaeangliae]|uniref:Uncharacterized protein n=1 Tax=Dufourea novaeangliae TaxID=178035 RepID=A0A154PB46_DUFNO|nr:hypothetical protein WN55_00756 [Dufourea novaeangliae]
MYTTQNQLIHSRGNNPDVRYLDIYVKSRVKKCTSVCYGIWSKYGLALLLPNLLPNLLKILLRCDTLTCLKHVCFMVWSGNKPLLFLNTSFTLFPIRSTSLYLDLSLYLDHILYFVYPVPFVIANR